MDTIFNNEQLENVLLIAVRLPTVGIKYLSEKTGVNINTLYKWSCGNSHLSNKNADAILNYLICCRPDALEAAISLYKGVDQND